MAAGAAETVREVLGGITSVPEEVLDYAAGPLLGLCLDRLQSLELRGSRHVTIQLTRQLFVSLELLLSHFLILVTILGAGVRRQEGVSLSARMSAVKNTLRFSLQLLDDSLGVSGETGGGGCELAQTGQLA